MTLEGLGWIVFVNGVVQLAGLVILILGQRAIARSAEEIARMTRAVAGLVYQEEEKTRALLKELLSREPGRA